MTYFNLSHPQQRIYQVESFYDRTNVNDVAGLVHFTNEMDLDLLEIAVNEMIRYNDGMRFRLYMIDGEVKQKEEPYTYEKVDLFDFTSDENGYEGWLDAMNKKRFELFERKLYYCAILVAPNRKHKFYIKFHHIISDAYSALRTFDQILEFYYGMKENTGFQPYMTSYKDFLTSETAYLQSERYQKDRDYWLGQFDGDLPERAQIKSGNIHLQSIDAKRVTYKFSGGLSQKLMDFSNTYGVSVPSIFFSTLALVISKYTGKNDFALGTMVLNRVTKEEKVTTGMFVSILPVRIKIDRSSSYITFLKSLKSVWFNVLKHQKYPYEELISELRRKHGQLDRLFDTLVSYQAGQTIASNVKKYKEDWIFCGYNGEPLSIHISDRAAQKQFVLEYDFQTAIFSETDIELFHQHFINLLETGMLEPDMELHRLSLLKYNERKLITDVFNHTTTSYPSGRTLKDLFEEQVLIHPEIPALISGKERLSYNELNEKANRVAHMLKGCGARPSDTIGIMCTRSVSDIVGITGIIKAGASYLPLDDDYPAHRMEYMLNDAGARILLVTEKNEKTEMLLDKQLMNLSDVMDDKEINADNPACIQSSDDIAYIMYTSGSIGDPKGVCVTHCNVVRLVRNTNYLDFQEEHRIFQIGSMAFDASTFEIWGALLNGHQLYIEPKHVILDMDILEKYMEENRITTAFITSSFFNQIVDQRVQVFKNIKYILTGGDIVSPHHASRLLKTYSHICLTDIYGPTENTTFSTFYRVGPCWDENKALPVGKPISNSTAYIVDDDGNLCAIGQTGEIWVGGDGIAKCYLNNEELTCQKFVPDIFKGHGRLYKTGDLGQWLPDGNILILGRRDNQVKIRGFRVETAEVERTILKNPTIREAVVVARQDGGTAYLCAYFVAEPGINLKELRQEVAYYLPEYMVPTYFVRMDSFPLTTNGKINKAMLPEPDQASMPQTTYVAASTDLEKIMEEVWKEVLQLPRIGIHDNFFQIGGDSIKAIQVVARIQRYGLKLEIQHLMKIPSIAQLCPYVVMDKVIASQDEIVGDVPLTPVQLEFFKINRVWNHFNQYVILHRLSGFSADLVKQAFMELTARHDALRMKYLITEKEIRQYNPKDTGAHFTLSVLDLDLQSAISGNEEKILVQDRINELNARIDLSTGPLVKLLLVRKKGNDRLVIMIHHLVVDGISWRILISDFNHRYTALEKGEAVQPLEKRSSYKDWSSALRNKAGDFEAEIPYWAWVTTSGAQTLQTDGIIDERLAGDMVACSMELDVLQTRQLQTSFNRVFNAGVPVALVTALALSVRELKGMDSFLLNMEGHGREIIDPAIDISGTVGWFTSIFPLLVHTKSGDNLIDTIKSVKETIAGVPHKGVGYGILKYLLPADITASVDFNNIPRISLNYLGQLDEGMDIQPSVSKDPGIVCPYAIDLNAMILNGRFTMTAGYHPAEFSHEFINQLIDRFNRNLVDILDICTYNSRVYTVSDFRDTALKVEDLEIITGKYGDRIEDIYGFSPWGRHLMNLHQTARDMNYFYMQLFVDIEGDLRFDIFKYAFDQVVRRYAVFRSVFIHNGVSTPKQVVLKDASVPVILEDIQGLISDEQSAAIDRVVGDNKFTMIDLEEKPSAKLIIFRLAPDRYKMIWSFHHLYLDGWSLGIVIKDIFTIYQAQLVGKQPLLDPVVPYADYIHWVNEEDNRKALDVWAGYLKDYSPVPLKDIQFKTNPLVPEVLLVTREQVTALEALTAKHNITMSSLFEAVSAKVFQRYYNRNDIVFQIFNSGRDSRVADIDRMVGLCSNEVLVRVNCSMHENTVQLAKKLQQDHIYLHDYETVAIHEVRKYAGIPPEQVGIAFVFENYPVTKEYFDLFSGGLGFKVSDTGITTTDVGGLTILAFPGQDELKVVFLYNDSLLSREEVIKMRSDCIGLLEELIES